MFFEKKSILENCVKYNYDFVWIICYCNIENL